MVCHVRTRGVTTTVVRVSVLLVVVFFLAAGVDVPSNSIIPETNFFEIIVPQGRIVVRLYDETPEHRDNFRRLAAESFYDGTTFHRVIDGFMIQGGDPNSRDADPTNDGRGGPGYTLPAEIVPDYFHKRGALAAAREGDIVNPERRSSGSQFYIVDGETFDPATLDLIQQQIRMTLGTNFTFSEEMRDVYATSGGAPHLDGQYTVFGEVVEGFEVLDAIAATETPRKLNQRAAPHAIDRPLTPVPMNVNPLPDYSAPTSQ